QIDIGAHLGGLIAGFIASAIVYLPRNKRIPVQLLSLILFILLLIGLFIFGMNNTPNQVTYHLIKIESFIKDGEYEDVISQATEALEDPGQFAAELLFQR